TGIQMTSTLNNRLVSTIQVGTPASVGLNHAPNASRLEQHPAVMRGTRRLEDAQARITTPLYRTPLATPSGSERSRRNRPRISPVTPRTRDVSLREVIPPAHSRSWELSSPVVGLFKCGVSRVDRRLRRPGTEHETRSQTDTVGSTGAPAGARRKGSLLAGSGGAGDADSLDDFSLPDGLEKTVGRTDQSRHFHRIPAGVDGALPAMDLVDQVLDAFFRRPFLECDPEGEGLRLGIGARLGDLRGRGGVFGLSGHRRGLTRRRNGLGHIHACRLQPIFQLLIAALQRSHLLAQRLIGCGQGSEFMAQLFALQIGP